MLRGHTSTAGQGAAAHPQSVADNEGRTQQCAPGAQGTVRHAADGMDNTRRRSSCGDGQSAGPPFGGVEQSLKYLARYTYRVAISNERIESLEDGQVTFRYKDYAHGHRQRRMTLTAREFLRRFMLHVLPRGFVRIRSFGFLANRVRDKQLALCRQLLHAPEPGTAAAPGAPASPSVPGDNDSLRCPHCGQGVLQLVRQTRRPRVPELVASTYQPLLFDSS